MMRAVCKKEMSRSNVSDGNCCEAESPRHLALQAQEEESRLFRYGPPPGDVAEVEAFCRIYRLAELLQKAVMASLRSLDGEVAPEESRRGDIPLAGTEATENHVSFVNRQNRSTHTYAAYLRT